MTPNDDKTINDPRNRAAAARTIGSGWLRREWVEGATYTVQVETSVGRIVDLTLTAEEVAAERDRRAARVSQ